LKFPFDEGILQKIFFTIALKGLQSILCFTDLFVTEYSSCPALSGIPVTKNHKFANHSNIIVIPFAVHVNLSFPHN